MRSDIDQALALLKTGGDEDLEKGLSLLQRSVFAFGMRVCGQRQDAEDTTQDVLLKMLPYVQKFENAKALTTWLFKVAKNRCLMTRRKSKFAPAQELSLDELMPDQKELEQLDKPSSVSPEGAAIQGEEGQRLREAIRTLPPAYRIVLVLRDMEGFTDEEAGEITGLRPGTIRVRLHRARLFVRRELANAKTRPNNSGQAAQKSVVASKPQSCRRMFAGLSDYLDGELDDFSCEEIEAHLNNCEPCKKFLRSLEQTIEQCQRAEADVPARERAATLRKQLLSTYSRALAAGRK
jgi:RNA polymerase sigma-70 factor (ECF subfamily)